mmetsp:Transcript_102616/g.153790  ORF Transcript_102616/g.153790 Transcript_102616/m.153790 type:complete len:238 (+) Transcript_102616:116-829(+)
MASRRYLPLTAAGWWPFSRTIMKPAAVISWMAFCRHLISSSVSSHSSSLAFCTNMRSSLSASLQSPASYASSASARIDSSMTRILMLLMQHRCGLFRIVSTVELITVTIAWICSLGPSFGPISVRTITVISSRPAAAMTPGAMLSRVMISMLPSSTVSAPTPGAGALLPPSASLIAGGGIFTPSAPACHPGQGMISVLLTHTISVPLIMISSPSALPKGMKRSTPVASSAEITSQLI